MPRRIRRPSSKEELLNQLTDKEKAGIFETYKDAILFAAALGAFKGSPKPFEQTSEPIDYNIFSKRSDNEAFIHLLAIYNKGNIEILSEGNSDERVTILEECANSGLEIIEAKIKNSTTILDAILDLIHTVDEETSTGERNFEEPILMNTYQRIILKRF